MCLWDCLALPSELIPVSLARNPLGSIANQGYSPSPHTPPLPSSTFRYVSRITYLPEIVTTRTICPAYDQNTLTRPALEPWLTEFHRPEHKATGSLHRLEFNRWSKKNSDIDEFYFCSYLQVFFIYRCANIFFAGFFLEITSPKEL